VDKGALAVVCQSDSEIPDALCQLENIYAVDEVNDFVTGLLSEVYGSDVASMDLIGITGTNGKTSSAHFTCQLLSLFEDNAGYIGTLGYGVVSDELYKGRNTTPDRITLYRYIARLKRMGCSKIVMEVSSHGIALGRIEGLEFVVGAFTNLSRDHLDFHMTMQAYEDTKLSFFNEYSIKKLVVNADDSVGKKLISRRSEEYASSLSCYGNIDSSLDECYRYSYGEAEGDPCIEVHHQDSRYQLKVSIKGKYNIENLMAAVLICHASGYPLSQIAAVTASVMPVPGRLECDCTPEGLSVCVDYAHSPAGMEAVLTDESLLPNDSSSTWSVFGCGGNRDKGKRHVMGKVASVYSDHVVITDDNTRGEEAEDILCDIVGGVGNKKGLTICRDRKLAITHAVKSAATDDLVLVLGKGDELMMDYGLDEVLHRDIDVVSQVVAGL